MIFVNCPLHLSALYSFLLFLLFTICFQVGLDFAIFSSSRRGSFFHSLSSPRHQKIKRVRPSPRMSFFFRQRWLSAFSVMSEIPPSGDPFSLQWACARPQSFFLKSVSSGFLSFFLYLVSLLVLRFSLPLPDVRSTHFLLSVAAQPELRIDLLSSLPRRDFCISELGARGFAAPSRLFQ